ncbi:hypothetical protein pb186bvf_000178 [Paramecium bursaria]
MTYKEPWEVCQAIFKNDQVQNGYINIMKNYLVLVLIVSAFGQNLRQETHKVVDVVDLSSNTGVLSSEVVSVTPPLTNQENQKLLSRTKEANAIKAAIKHSANGQVEEAKHKELSAIEKAIQDTYPAQYISFAQIHQELEATQSDNSEVFVETNDSSAIANPQYEVQPADETPQMGLEPSKDEEASPRMMDTFVEEQTYQVIDEEQSAKQQNKMVDSLLQIPTEGSLEQPELSAPTQDMVVAMLIAKGEWKDISMPLIGEDVNLNDVNEQKNEEIKKQAQAEAKNLVATASPDLENETQKMVEQLQDEELKEITDVSDNAVEIPTPEAVDTEIAKSDEVVDTQVDVQESVEQQEIALPQVENVIADNTVETESVTQDQQDQNQQTEQPQQQDVQAQPTEIEFLQVVGVAERGFY